MARPGWRVEGARITSAELVCGVKFFKELPEYVCVKTAKWDYITQGNLF